MWTRLLTHFYAYQNDALAIYKDAPTSNLLVGIPRTLLDLFVILLRQFHEDARWRPLRGKTALTICNNKYNLPKLRFGRKAWATKFLLIPLCSLTRNSQIGEIC
jgi:hypothetical protein